MDILSKMMAAWSLTPGNCAITDVYFVRYMPFADGSINKGLHIHGDRVGDGNAVHGWTIDFTVYVRNAMTVQFPGIGYECTPEAGDALMFCNGVLGDVGANSPQAYATWHRVVPAQGVLAATSAQRPAEHVFGDRAVIVISFRPVPLTGVKRSSMSHKGPTWYDMAREFVVKHGLSMSDVQLVVDVESFLRFLIRNRVYKRIYIVAKNPPVALIYQDGTYTFLFM
jgi:hypothetical protein